jgi:hypothetical protein
MDAGKKLAVRLRASRPDGSIIRGQAVALFFGPGKDPERVPADRVPDRTVPLSFDEPSRMYVAEVSSRGWEPGEWRMQGAVLGADGAPDGWGWFTFTLDP